MTASCHNNDEIDRLTQDIRILEEEISAMSRRSRPVFRQGHDPSPIDTPPSLKPFGLSAASNPAAADPPRSRKTRPKEIEARRYNGKESIAEYLLQFELTARRNGWTDSEKATNLLCALDGPARNLLAEINIDTVSYETVKDLLTKRFGPVLLPEIHEQALQDIRLARNQPIRELTPEITRLSKLAYPELDEFARERFAVKALINAIPDRDATFYVREKNPHDLDEVCVLYERYRVLTGHTISAKPATVKGVKPPEPGESPAKTIENHILELMNKQAEAQNRQLAQLTESIQKLLQPTLTSAVPAQSPAPLPVPVNNLGPRFQAPGPNPGQPGLGSAPRKPCPKCGQAGHWARDCTQPETCFRCGQPGHRRNNCQMPLNMRGPVSAPHTGPSIPHPC